MMRRAMPNPQADRPLRAMVARLKLLTPADFDAVMEDMDEDQRARVIRLLADLEGADEASVLAAEFSIVAFDPVILPPDLSPWLIARINGKGDGGEETADQFDMTSFAHASLRNTAASLVPQPVKRPQSTSLLGRFWKAMA